MFLPWEDIIDTYNIYIYNIYIHTYNIIYICIQTYICIYNIHNLIYIYVCVGGGESSQKGRKFQVRDFFFAQMIIMIRPHKTRSFHLSIPAQADKHFLLGGIDETYHGGTRPPGEISFDVTLASLFKGLRKWKQSRSSLSSLFVCC